MPCLFSPPCRPLRFFRTSPYRRFATLVGACIRRRFTLAGLRQPLRVVWIPCSLVVPAGVVGGPLIFGPPCPAFCLLGKWGSRLLPRGIHSWASRLETWHPFLQLVVYSHWVVPFSAQTLIPWRPSVFSAPVPSFNRPLSTVLWKFAPPLPISQLSRLPLRSTRLRRFPSLCQRG